MRFLKVSTGSVRHEANLLSSTVKFDAQYSSIGDFVPMENLFVSDDPAGNAQ